MLPKLVADATLSNGKAVRPVQLAQDKLKSVTDCVSTEGNVPVSPVQLLQALVIVVTFEVLVGGLKTVILLPDQALARLVNALLVVIWGNVPVKAVQPLNVLWSVVAFEKLVGANDVRLEQTFQAAVKLVPSDVMIFGKPVRLMQPDQVY